MHSFHVLIIGAGPADIAAAIAARKAGVKVGVVDDNFAVGGQIWRSGVPGAWAQAFANSGAQLLSGARIFDAPEPGLLMAKTPESFAELRYEKLILTTGARELFLPFPGWTLPNIMGAGGLQAMVKGGLNIAGKRVVVAGSGPLLIAVAASLLKHGAKVRAIVEQASNAHLASFAAAIARQPAKAWQGSQLLWALRNTPMLRDVYPVRAEGEGRVQRVILSNGAGIDCDYLACGFGLVPNTELAGLLGCRLNGDFVEINQARQTSIEAVYAAGELTGIGGLEKSLVEGEIAAYEATGNLRAAQALDSKRKAAQSFQRAIESAFALRPELFALADYATKVCRCEDVTLGAVAPFHSWREAKLHTRCGMGPCQGRICGPILRSLKGWRQEGVRPPIFPVDVAAIVKAH